MLMELYLLLVALTHMSGYGMLSNSDNPEQSNQEMDLLCGHENDVNYVQFRSREYGGGVLSSKKSQLREEWEVLADCYEDHMSSSWISNNLLRPFLFYVTHSPILWRWQIRNVKCITKCFGILLQSISSTGMQCFISFIF